MRAVVQRVRSASVHVADQEIARVARGLAILVGVGQDDRPEDGERLAAKLLALRIFDDDGGKLGRTVLEVGGAVLVVPQFTLYGDIRHGRRPDFAHTAKADVGRRLFDAFCGALRGGGASVSQGAFGADMRVVVEGDGPVTIVMSTDGWPEGDLGRGGPTAR